MQGDLLGTILTGGTTGLIAAMVLLIGMFIKGVIVPGYLYKATESKLARYEELAYKAMALAERAAAKDGAA